MESLEHKGYTINIEPDVHCDSPDQSGDDSLFLVGFHRDFTVERHGFGIGNVRSLFNGNKYEDDSKNEEAADIAKRYHVFPLEAYIHSGVVLHLAGEAKIDRAWDVSLLGAVFVERKHWKTRKAAEKAARSLIDEWNQYLAGDVWYVDVQDGDGESLDSCGGIYGYEHAKQSGIDTADRLAEFEPQPFLKKDARKILSDWWEAGLKPEALETVELKKALQKAINSL